MVKIENVQVYGYTQSIIRSGYPLHNEANISNDYFKNSLYDQESFSKCVNRTEKLGPAKSGSGHDCFLKGIIVQGDFTFPQYIWQQIKRYGWFDIVSSCSTMHCITKIDINQSMNGYVYSGTISFLQSIIASYNHKYLKYPIYIDHKEINDKDEHFSLIVSNIPSGLMLKAGVTTNYLQLKTIYHQRKHHKLHEWREFCRWCESLMGFKQIVLGQQ